jgi:hypothetical protein
MMGAAFCEGLAAHREYEALRSRGMAHERALREALGLGCSRLPRENGHAVVFCRTGMSDDRGRAFKLIGRVLRNANPGTKP